MWFEGNLEDDFEFPRIYTWVLSRTENGLQDYLEMATRDAKSISTTSSSFQSLLLANGILDP